MQINLLLLRTSFKSAATNTVTGINSNSEKNQLGKKLHKLVIRKIKKHKVLFKKNILSSVLAGMKLTLWN